MNDPRWHKRVRSSRVFRHQSGQYSVTVDKFNQIWDEQEGKCAICKNPFENKAKATIDHCHSSRRIRGLLCKGCNVGIGELKDNVDYLRYAIDYIEKHRETKRPTSPSISHASAKVILVRG